MSSDGRPSGHHERGVVFETPRISGNPKKNSMPTLIEYSIFPDSLLEIILKKIIEIKFVSRTVIMKACFLNFVLICFIKRKYAQRLAPDVLN